MVSLHTRLPGAWRRLGDALTLSLVLLAVLLGVVKAQPGCSGTLAGGNAIAFSLDTSGSISWPDFIEAKAQVEAFINQTSGIDADGKANSNVYYLNTFASTVLDTTGNFTTNAGGRAAQAVAAIPGRSGGTVIAAGIVDLTAQFQALGGTANKLAVVITDGDGGRVLDAADALRAEGVTVVAVGLGTGPSASTLEAIACAGSDGSELVFANADFSEIAALVVQALEAIDTDGDGANDCDDGCPDDPNKTEPGVCGCNQPETPRCGAPLPEDIDYTGGGAIGISLDCSGALTEDDFAIAVSQTVAFIDASSGVTSAAGINSNLYYVNCFSSSVSASTATFLTNANRQVSVLVEQFVYQAGSTNIAAGIDDLTLQFRSVSVTVSAIACVVAAGSSPRASVAAAGGRLQSSTAGGVSIVGVAVAGSTSVAALEAISARTADGSPLVFRPSVFTRIAVALTSTVISIDSDGDGVPDAEDGCPADAAKTAPGRCGCGAVEEPGCVEARDCSGGNAIALTIDGSGSIGTANFNEARRQMVAFIDATSGVTSPMGVNNNLYYASAFTFDVDVSTGDFMTNDKRRVSKAVEAILYPSRSANVVQLALEDVRGKFANLTQPAAKLAIAITDGRLTGAINRSTGTSPELAEEAADRLREDGVTVAAVGIGSVSRPTLELIASSGADERELVFEAAEFTDIGGLLSEALSSIDTDGDGVDDCLDGCPDNAAKTAPGRCGCQLPETPSCGGPVPQCTGGNAIGISLDTSDSVSAQEFLLARTQVLAFVNATSAVNSARGANSNLYYANTFTSMVRDTTGSFRNNSGGAVSAAIEANLVRRTGDTSIDAGLRDLSTAFSALDGDLAGIAIVITDGRSSRTAAVRAAGALRREGVTVVAVAVGSGPDITALEAVASAGSDGSALVFAAEEFGDIAELLADALELIDSDGDGVPDCEDECPLDASKTRAGSAGCGFVV